jgi:hypothetical protein
MVNVISYGINYIGDSKGIHPGLHSEIDALIKLKSIKNIKKYKSINLLVIRFSKKNKLQSSKPCINCICSLKHLSNKFGLNIKHVYYSDDDNIVKTNLDLLINDDNKHVCSFVNNFY